MRIKIEKIKSTIETNLAVVKIRFDSEDMISTGFLVKNSYVLMPKQAYSSSFSSKKLKIVLPDDSEIRLLESEKIEVFDYFVLAKLESTVKNFLSISLENQVFYREKLVGVAFYYTKKLPILQKYQKEFRFEEIFSFESNLGKGAEGSPLLTIDNKLLGVYIGENRVVSMTLIAKALKSSKNPVFSDKTQWLATTPDIVHELFPITTCYLDVFRKKLVYYDPNEIVNKTVSIPEITTGSTALVTSYGVIIIISNTIQPSQALLFDGSIVRKLPNLKNPHSHHTNTLIDENIFIISGNTTAVEIFDLISNT